MAVTGPKTDDWLVKTVGVLVTAIGIVLITSVWRRTLSLETCLLAVLSAAGLATIDIYYAGVVERIWKVYLADAAPELCFVIAWPLLYGRSAGLQANERGAA